VIDHLASAEFDAEGRYLRADFGRLSVVSLYQPSGLQLRAERQEAKFRFMALIGAHLLAPRRPAAATIIVCGDWNIAHQEIDLRNWRSNRGNSGFLPEERAWVSRLLDEGRLVRRVPTDCTRKATGESYTWWSNRGQAWAKNVGWRLDYQLATAAIAGTARRAAIYKEERFSDHAPLTIDYEYDLETDRGE
jgi:exodeoxyribonuclease-3